jgi:hypothetical protein
MNITDIFKLIGSVLTAGPTIIQLISTILQAFNALPAAHQTAVTSAVQAHMATKAQ